MKKRLQKWFLESAITDIKKNNFFMLWFIIACYYLGIYGLFWLVEAFIFLLIFSILIQSYHSFWLGLISIWLKNKKISDK